MRTGAESGRQLGVLAATAMVTGQSISLGIFLTPASMARSLGSPALLTAVWLGMAIITLAGALCFSELAVRNPEDGGEYLYLNRGFGPRLAFLYGWMASLILYPGVAAALAVGVVPYLQSLLDLPGGMASVLPPSLILLAGGLHLLGARLSAGMMSALNWLKVPVLAALILWASLPGHASPANLFPLTLRRPGSDPLLPAVAAAASGAWFALGGWWEAAAIAGQVRRPERTLPVAFVAGVMIVSAVYILLSLAFVAVVPMERIQSNTAFVAQFGAALFGVGGVRVLSACVVLGVLGGLMALFLAAPRVTRAVALAEAAGADDGLLAPLSRLHPRTRVPVLAVVLQTVAALAILALGAFDRILAFLLLPSVVFLALAAATLFRLHVPVRRRWYPLAPILFILGSALLAALILLRHPASSLVGVAIVLAGWPLRRMVAHARGAEPAAGTPSPIPAGDSRQLEAPTFLPEE